MTLSRWDNASDCNFGGRHHRTLSSMREGSCDRIAQILARTSVFRAPRAVDSPIRRYTFDTVDWRSHLARLREEPRGAPSRLPAEFPAKRENSSLFHCVSRSSRRFYRLAFDPPASFWQIVSRNSTSLEAFFRFRCDLPGRICLTPSRFHARRQERKREFWRTYRYVHREFLSIELTFREIILYKYKRDQVSLPMTKYYSLIEFN